MQPERLSLIHHHLGSESSLKDAPFAPTRLPSEIKSKAPPVVFIRSLLESKEVVGHNLLGDVHFKRRILSNPGNQGHPEHEGDDARESIDLI
jgi:hypothetical protein